jgi:hypothetical protein
MDLSREIWGFMSDLTDRYRIQWIFQEHLQETMFFFYVFFMCIYKRVSGKFFRSCNASMWGRTPTCKENLCRMHMAGSSWPIGTTNCGCFKSWRSSFAAKHFEPVPYIHPWYKSMLNVFPPPGLIEQIQRLNVSHYLQHSRLMWKSRTEWGWHSLTGLQPARSATGSQAYFCIYLW